jgi:type II secretory pathway pseudopilin PulG
VLIEVVVVLALLAILAVLIVPGAFRQLQTREANRAVSQLSAFRGAIELFQLDLRGVCPSTLTQLIHPIAPTDTQLSGETYTLAQVARWAGPYVELDLSAELATTADALVTAFGGKISNRLAPFKSSLNNAVWNDPGDADFAAVWITGLIGEEFEQLNKLIDGDQEPEGLGPGESRQAGKLRFFSFPPWHPGLVGGDTFYLAFPC